MLQSSQVMGRIRNLLGCALLFKLSHLVAKTFLDIQRGLEMALGEVAAGREHVGDEVDRFCRGLEDLGWMKVHHFFFHCCRPPLGTLHLRFHKLA
jgi:hypothetical protein